MNTNNSGDITQKDLLKLLFDQAQHNATREEVNALELRIGQRIDKLEDKTDERFDKVQANMDEQFEKVDKQFEKVDARFEKMDKKFERLTWLLITTLAAVVASLALQVVK